MKASRRRIRVLTARNALARGLPASLPETDVEEIPVFGTSWYTRRVSYYLLRVLASLLLLGVLVGAVGIDVSVVWAFDDLSSGATLAWRLGLGIVFLGSFVWPLWRLRRQRERRRAGEMVYPKYRAGESRAPIGRTAVGALVGAAVGMNALVRSESGGLSILAAVFLIPGPVFFLGWCVVGFLETFRQEYGVEHDARLRLQRREKWQASNQLAPPVG